MPSRIECPVCLDEFTSPVTAPCGHTLCRECYVSLTQTRQALCPTCRAPIPVTPPAINIAIRDLLEQLHVGDDAPVPPPPPPLKAPATTTTSRPGSGGAPSKPSSGGTLPSAPAPTPAHAPSSVPSGGGGGGGGGAAAVKGGGGVDVTSSSSAASPSLPSCISLEVAGSSNAWVGPDEVVFTGELHYSAGKVKVSGAGGGAKKSWQGRPCLQHLKVSGSGTITVSCSSKQGGVGCPLDTDHCSVHITGSGDVVLPRKARLDNLSVSISGSGDCSGGVCSRLSAKIMGSGDISATAYDTASATIMGSGDIDLVVSRQCRVSQSVMGSGDIQVSIKEDL
jgi:hypothetical protein